MMSQYDICIDLQRTYKILFTHVLLRSSAPSLTNFARIEHCSQVKNHKYRKMKCKVPEISWHNRDPVLSVDLQLKKDSKDVYRLASGGADCLVLIWNLKFSSDDTELDLDLTAELNRHQRAVNVVRWSPNGELLASGDDASVIFLWKQKFDFDLVNICDNFNDFDKEVWITWKILRGHLEDVYDLNWAQDSQFLVSGSVDNSAIIWDIHKGTSLAILNEHKGFVQGVAWDPKNRFIATLSSDRYLRLFDVKTKKVLYRVNKGKVSKNIQHEMSNRNVRLFHDDTLQTFFRRLTFTPDGELLLTPSGTTDYEGVVNPIHTTYIFSRFSLSKPSIILPSPDQYTVAIRCCPILYSLRPHDDNCPPVISLPYRMVFAVASKSSVLFYDTQQRQPFALVSNIHYTRLTDLTWSVDGRFLIVSSTDGFCSIITFEIGELGEIYEKSEEILSGVSVNDFLSKEKKFIKSRSKKEFKKKENAKEITDKSIKKLKENMDSEAKLGNLIYKLQPETSVGCPAVNEKKNMAVSLPKLNTSTDVINGDFLSYEKSLVTIEAKNAVSPIIVASHPQTPNSIEQHIATSEHFIISSPLKKVFVPLTTVNTKSAQNRNKVDELDCNSLYLTTEKTPRRVALKTISTPKSKKKLLDRKIT